MRNVYFHFYKSMSAGCGDRTAPLEEIALRKGESINLRFSSGPEYAVSLERLRDEAPVLYSWAMRVGGDGLQVKTIDEEVGEAIAAFLRFRLEVPHGNPLLVAGLEKAADYLCMDGLARHLAAAKTQRGRLAMCANCGIPFFHESNHSKACPVRPSVKRGSDWICTQCGLKTTICNQQGACRATLCYHYSLT